MDGWTMPKNKLFWLSIVGPPSRTKRLVKKKKKHEWAQTALECLAHSRTLIRNPTVEADGKS